MKVMDNANIMDGPCQPCVDQRATESVNYEDVSVYLGERCHNE